MTTSFARESIEVGPNLIRCPFLILIDKAEKAPWTFAELRARSFIDKDMRDYVVRTDRRYLGVGMGDYSIEGYQDRFAIERKSMADFQGTLLGWRREAEAGPWTIDVDRRARFKRELQKLSTLDAKAVIIEANLGHCLTEAPEWGVRSSGENGKYLHATFIAWQQEFPGVPWIFCEDRRMAEITAFRMIEQFWARHAKERRQQMRQRAKSALLF